MRAVQESDLINKTIKSVDTQAVNVLKITFSDDTTLDIWNEPAVHTQYGDIGGFFVFDESPPETKTEIVTDLCNKSGTEVSNIKLDQVDPNDFLGLPSINDS